MARIKKKGTSGNAKNFITRTQAVRKLQISLPDFRRLCIFKGIYPREPRNKKKANKGSTAATTFYYTKDIQYLLHEPVLTKFREHKTFAKKLQKALGRGDYGDAKRLEQFHKPVVTLDHIVKERYPTFTDALRDLDDALSLLFLFANLPTNHNLPTATVANCERLCNEWQHYVIRAKALRKSFLSIKGIYYQAEIQGQDILWLVPYKFAQNVPADVDFRIMHTFVEFYTTLLGFVMFKLYTNEGLVYPPKFDKEADGKGAGLRAFKLENKGIGMVVEGIETEMSKNRKEIREAAKQTKLLQDKISAITEGEDEEVTAALEKPESEAVDGFDSFKPIKSDSAVDVLPQPQISSNTNGDVDPSNLFAPYTFYLSRETPREPLEFLLRSFGCKRIGWDAVLGDGSFTDNELDPSITHQIVDRPPVVGLPPAAVDTVARPGGRVPGRIYIQPQYVWDCINAARLIPTAEYAPGALLPPHLSPWVKVSTGEYDPTAPVAAGEEEEEVESEDEDDHGMTEDLGEEDESMEVEADVSEEEEEESEDEEEAARRQHQKELEAEATGVKLAAEEKKKQKKKKSKAEREAEEQKEMQKIMMTKKKRKLYEKMIYSNKKKEDEAENLRQKRRKLEKSKKAAAA
ncbi:Pescadillo N-terminus-domain-containing protein [Sphaerosporella brunnea]|uniref:Pescadillo homolog n=1 Tax=Sphaerosporella brunnea TaxID=1250544 RepID=A0A5J5EVD0_9PEZI|nr:Pescadillo N-terminus-domain-containing protein [Sphaerosporella brunnea]